MELSPVMTMREILRPRPRAIEALDIAIGAEFWDYLDRPISDTCRDKALKPNVLLHRISTLARVPGDCDWSSMPVYYLVDHLADDHRRFRERDIPGIEERLAECDPSDFPGEFPLEEYRLRFHSFKMDFLLHMNEEEEFLFPNSLRTEARLQHPELPPGWVPRVRQRLFRD